MTDQTEPKRILVADDDPAMRLLLAASLRAAGYAVDLAATGREALAQLRAQPADLVLLDVQMPELGGIETLAELRSDRALRSLPAIAITAYPTPESRALAFEMDAQAYLSKPVERTLLLREVARWLDGGADAVKTGTVHRGAAPPLSPGVDSGRAN